MAYFPRTTVAAKTLWRAYYSAAVTTLPIPSWRRSSSFAFQLHGAPRAAYSAIALAVKQRRHTAGRRDIARFARVPPARCGSRLRCQRITLPRRAAAASHHTTHTHHHTTTHTTCLPHGFPRVCHATKKKERSLDPCCSSFLPPASAWACPFLHTCLPRSVHTTYLPLPPPRVHCLCLPAVPCLLAFLPALPARLTTHA